MADDTATSPTKRRRLIFGVALAVYVAVLAALAIRRANALADADDFTILAFADPRKALPLLLQLAGVQILGMLQFVPLGIIAMQLFPPVDGPWRRRFVRAALPAFGVAVVAVYVVGAVARGGFPPFYTVALPIFGAFIGVWFTGGVRRGSRGIVGLVMQFAIGLVVLLLLGALTIFISLQSAPMPFEAAAVTSEGKKRLVDKIRGKHPRRVPLGETVTVELTTADFDLLTAWGLRVLGPKAKARAAFEPGTVDARASVELPFGIAGRRFVNAAGRVQIAIDKGRVALSIDDAKIGSLSVPGVVLDALSPLIVDSIHRDYWAQHMLPAVAKLVVREGSSALTYGRVAIPAGFLSEVFGGGGTTEALVADVREHILRLAELPDAKAEERVARAVELAFGEAKKQTDDGGDAVEANRAAAIALGVVLGTHRLKRLVGPVMTLRTGYQVYDVFKRSTMQGRADWTKHFFVSVAASVLANTSVADAVGLLKEELDAQGGSGFSFGDLLADRAGTTFGEYAVRDASSAKALQARIAKGFELDDFFPTKAKDLPEGIPLAELKAKYGGVDGPRYKEVAAEIERRVAACPAYRGSR